MHHGQPSSDRVRISILVPGPERSLIIDIRKTVGTDCNAADNSNAGCGVQVNKANSYGPPFNSAGGGWYAMERTNQHINVYFWSRNDGSVPSDLKNGASTINTSNWVSCKPPKRISAPVCADGSGCIIGYARCELPEHGLQHRIGIRAEQHRD